MPDLTARTLSYVRLSDVRFATVNAKAHDIPALQASISRWGPVDLPVVDERTGELVAGNGRAEALIELRAAGEPAPSGVHIDDDGEWLIPVVRGWASIDDADARAAAVTLNRLQEVGGWDRRALAVELEEMAASVPDVFDLLGYTAEEVDALARLVDDENRPPSSAGQEKLPAKLEDDEDGDDPVIAVDDGEIGPDDGGPTPERPGTVECPKCGHHWLPRDATDPAD